MKKTNTVRMGKGVRFYEGRGEARGLSESSIDAMRKVTMAPSDSLRSEDVRNMITPEDYDRVTEKLQSGGTRYKRRYKS